MQKWSQDGRMFDSFFFRTFMDLDFISVDKTQKKKTKQKTRPISSHLDLTHGQ